MYQETGRQFSITRRALLLLGGRYLMMAGALVPPSAVANHLLRERVLSLDVLHTGEKFRSVYWADGRYIMQTLREIHYLLRDHRTNEVKVIDVKLLDLLYDIHYFVASRTPFQIISGYRSPATNRQLQRVNPHVASCSYHTQGMAIDVRLSDRDLVRLKAAALRLNRGGVGYYPTAAFLHIDVGPKRQW